MGDKKNGYNRYKEIFDNIKELCYIVGEPKNVIEGPLEGIAEETCEDDCKHYILGNGLHVYIRDEYIYISENDLQYWGDERGRKGEELGQFYLSYNKESIESICHADKGRPYVLVQYFNHEAEETIAPEENAQQSGRWGNDNVCIPHSFGNLNKTSGTSEYVPEDIGRAIYLHMGENIHQDVRAICNKIIALNEKIKEYERGTYIQELLKSEEMLLKLKEALQKLREEFQDIDENKIEDKGMEIEGKRLEIEYLERKIKKIREKINQMLHEIQVSDDDIEQNSAL